MSFNNKFMICIILIATVLFLTFVIAKEENDKSFKDKLVGQWVNVKTDTRGYPKLEIKKADDSLTIHLFGKKGLHKDTDYLDLGTHVIYLLGNSIKSKTFYSGFVTWESNFKKTYLTIALKGDGNILTIDGIYIFKDKSQRSNYRKRYLFERKKF